MSEKFSVKDNKPAVLYRWTGTASGVVIPGVAARDLTVYDWATYSPSQRSKVERSAAQKGGAYEKTKTPAPVVETGPAVSAGEGAR